MKKIILSSILALGVFASANSQVVYKEGFTTGSTTATNSAYFSTTVVGYSATRTTTGAGSNYTTITRTTGAAQYGSMAYSFYTNPENNQTPPTPKTAITSIDMSGGQKDTIFVIARSTTAGTVLRMDIQVSTSPAYTSDFNVTNTATLTTAFALYKFIYAVPQDKYSICGSSSTAPCPNAPVDKAHIGAILFSLNNGTAGVAADADIDYLQVGGNSSAITIVAAGGGGAPGFVVASTATEEAIASVSSDDLYPNPAESEATIDLKLKSVSDVKVTVSDLMGKEVMTVFNGTASEVYKTINVANLNKGIYTVNYFVNGSPARSKRLMVK